MEKRGRLGLFIDSSLLKSTAVKIRKNVRCAAWNF